MKEPIEGTNYYFVDESGDPVFFDRNGTLIVGKDGCSTILIMGFVETTAPENIRKGLAELRKQILVDPYLSEIPSLSKTKFAFHATDDCAEVRQAVFKKIAEFDFKAQFVVARKIEQVFRRRFNGDENKFYDHLITVLFQNVLHRYNRNRIYFAKRGSKKRQKPLNLAIRKAIRTFEIKWETRVASHLNISVAAQAPSGEPCLQIIDYMNWAVYRAFIKQEMRFFRTVEPKISFLLDLYDSDKYPKNYYSRNNPFDCKKISPILARSP